MSLMSMDDAWVPSCTLSLSRRGKRSHRTSPRKGQAAVEFALVGGILILILFGIVEVGRLMFIRSEIENAAAEGAQVAALTMPCPDQATLQTKVVTAAKSKLVLADKNTLAVGQVNPPTCQFCPVSVSVTATWSSVLPILGNGQISKTSSKFIEYYPGSCP